MKKIIFIAVALIVALGGLGVGYAAWTDQITISGTVNTGSLNLVVERVNGDSVYKDIGTDALVYDHWIYDYTVPGYIDPKLVPTVNQTLIAWTESALVADDTVTISYHNLFPFDGPYTGFVTSVLFHCVGTVPVKIDADAVVTGLECTDVLYRWFYYDTDGITLLDSEIDVPNLDGLDGIQMHNCQTVSIGISVVVPQEDCAMNEDGNITVTIDGIQWNEYVAD